MYREFCTDRYTGDAAPNLIYKEPAGLALLGEELKLTKRRAGVYHVHRNRPQDAEFGGALAMSASSSTSSVRFYSPIAADSSLARDGHGAVSPERCQRAAGH